MLPIPLCSLASFLTGVKPWTFCVVMRNIVAGSIHRGLSSKALLKIGSQWMWEFFAGVDGSIFVLIEFIWKRVRA
jgi:uncharacterized membrane protein YdcZ (DUF606 family)